MNSVDGRSPRIVRIKALDGLRGIAILLVIFFHAYCGWAQVLPYGHRFAEIFIFKFGFLGVQLFFLISGFVIFMTLEQCKTFKEFIARRWLRLFPAMLFCSLLIFFTAPLFPERPLGQPCVRDLLPGLTFLEPSLWGRVFGSPQGSIEGSFWSLFVEVKFYFVFGALYFLYRQFAIFGLIGLFLLSMAGHAWLKADMSPHYHVISTVIGWLDFLSAQHYGWFAAGALYYKYSQQKTRRYLAAALLMALIASWSVPVSSQSGHLAAVLIVLLFSSAIVSTWIQKVLSNPVLLFLGFISYPLYLIHENMMVSLIKKMAMVTQDMPQAILPLFPIMVVLGVGAITATYVEPLINPQLRTCCQRFHVFFRTSS